MLLTVLMAVGATSAWAGENTATLLHTAAIQGGSNASETSLDQATHYYNNWGATSWAAQAYAGFSFTIPDGESITKAELTFYSKCGGSRDGREVQVYAKDGKEFDYENLTLSAASGTLVGKATDNRTVEMKTMDATSAVKAVVEAGSSEIVFVFGGAAAGATLEGKLSDQAPTLVITTADASTQTTYTVHFTDGTSELKDAAVYQGTIGENATASADDMASFKVGDERWNYVSGNATITLEKDGSKNNITLTFKKAATLSYVVRAVDGDNNLIAELKKASGLENDNIEAAWPRFVNKEGTLYLKDAVNKQYFSTVTLTEDNQTIDYTYSATETKGIKFLIEGEDIADATVISTGNTRIRSSNAASAFNGTESDLKLTTLPAGSYKLYAVGYFQSNSAEGTVEITDGTEAKLTVTGSGSNWTSNESSIELDSETTLYLAKGNKNGALDFLYIQDATEEKPIFRVTTDEGLEMQFKVTDQKAKTCEVYGVMDKAAISRETEDAIVIPATANGYKVTGISDWAFRNCQKITSATLPSGITYIGASAFRTCYALTAINFPEGLETIGEYAFYGPKMPEVTLPSTMKTIGKYAFDRISNGGAIKTQLYCNMTTPCTLGEQAFNRVYTILHVPAGCNNAYDEAWPGFKMIVDPDAKMFTNTVGGRQMNFRIVSETEKTAEVCISPDFENGKAMEFLDGETRGFCLGERNLIIPAEVTYNDETYSVIGIAANAFSETWWVGQTLTIPEGVKYIGQRAFYNNDIETVILPSTLTTIGDAAFGKSWNMHEMKSGAKEPAKNTVARAYSTAQMPGSILRVPVGTTAAYEANGYLNFFETIEEYQPNGYVFTATTEQGLDMKFRIVDENEKTVEAYGTYDGGPAISNKTEGELIIPAEIEGYRVVGISSWAFRNCQQLTSVSIPVGVTYIGESAFRTCYALASANIPEGVTTIGSRAFFDCKLNFIDLPSTLTEMGDRAFRNTDVKGEETEEADEAVPYIVIANMPEPIVLDGDIYIYYPERQDLYVPKGSKELYKAATMWKSFRNIYELGEEINTEHLALKAADIKVKAGEETTLNINLNTTVSTYRGYQFKLMLPEGVTITTDEKGKLNMKSAYTNEYMSVRGALQGDGSYIILSYATEGAVASSGNGLMLSLTVSADKTMTAGTYNGSIEDIVFATEDNKSDKPASSTFTVTLEADEPVEQAPVYTENVEGNAGVEITMPVGLNNSTSIAGFVFQLTLPKGFTVPTDGSGKLQAELVGDYKSIPVAVAKDPSGTNVYNLYAFGLDNSTFKAKAGHVLDVKVNIPADMPSGDYAVKTKTLNFNLIDSEGSDEARSISNLAKAARKAGAEQNVTSYSTITVKGGTTTLGDVNNDNIVNVTDVTMTISYILGQNPAGFNTTTADVDNSGKIDITDVTTIIDMILKSK